MSVLEVITNLMAEPGYRQMVVGGAAAVLGAVTRLAEMKTHPYRLFSHNAFPPSVSIGVPTAAALEESIVHSSPVMDNHVVEVGTDIAVAAVGYKAGEYAARKVGGLFGLVSMYDLENK